MMAIETRTFYKMQENIFNFATQVRFDSFAACQIGVLRYFSD